MITLVRFECDLAGRAGHRLERPGPDDGIAGASLGQEYVEILDEERRRTGERDDQGMRPGRAQLPHLQQPRVQRRHARAGQDRGERPFGRRRIEWLAVVKCHVRTQVNVPGQPVRHDLPFLGDSALRTAVGSAGGGRLLREEAQELLEAHLSRLAFALRQANADRSTWSLMCLFDRSLPGTRQSSQADTETAREHGAPEGNPDDGRVRTGARHASIRYRVEPRAQLGYWPTAHYFSGA